MKQEEAYPRIYLYRRIVQAKLYIDHHYFERIELDNIAGEASFSKFHFLRLFRQTYRKTPHQYLMSVRIEASKLLLQNGMPITEACMEVGFESVSSFTGLFKRYEKITPSAYQALHQRKKEEIGKKPLKFVPNCFAEKKGWTKNSNSQEADS